MPGTQSKTTLGPVIVVHGDANLLVREATDRVIRQAFPDGVPELAISEFEAATANLADVLDELRTLPFLSERRLVLIRNAEPFISKHRDALERYLDAPSPTGILLLVAKTFDARTRLYKAVQKRGQAIKCQAPSARQIPSWIVDRSKAVHDKRIDREAVDRLRALVGDDLSALEAELEKLALFVGDRPGITAADVEALVGQNREEKVFGIIDAMASGDAGTALGLWHQVWATDRAAVGRAIGGLAFSLRRLLEAKQSADEGVPLAAIARKLWTDPDVLAGRLRRCSSTGLQDQLAALLDADVASKTGWTNVRNAVEKFIVTQCSHLPRAQTAAAAFKR